MRQGCPYGSHRVLEPPGVLPQQAWKIDNTMDIYDSEVLIDVQYLNIDAASFTQLEHEAGGDERKIAEQVLDIVARRGKMHNPVTGSGGMLIGTVKAVGPEANKDLVPGDRIATLVSLSLTPLRVDEILEVRKDTDQLAVKAQAILFASGIYAKLPGDLNDTLALAVLDVAGAPAQTAKLVKPGDTVFIIGAGGKSGLLCLYEAKKAAGAAGRVIALGHSDASCERIRELGAADVILQGSAQDAVGIMEKVKQATGGKLADVTINCVNVPGTEMASILATRDEGTVYFFSMATSFTAAALGAEGAGKDVQMIIGNGYTRGHADLALNVLRESPVLREMFTRLYA